MNADLHCQLLPWDSRFFGRRIARLHAEQLAGPEVDRVLDWCQEHRIDCLYFLADARDSVSRHCALAAGFRFVGERLTLQRAVTAEDAAEPPSDVRPCRAADIDILAGIAGRIHTDTRFYRDPHFEPARCSELYRTWLRNSCWGLADVVLVADDDAPTAYITCRRLDRTVGEIGLLGVHPEAQGRGLGRRLLAASVAWGRKEGLQRLSVVTQGDNASAVRAYRRAGFEPVRMQHWFHYWRSRAAAPPRRSEKDLIGPPCTHEAP